METKTQAHELDTPKPRVKIRRKRWPWIVGIIVIALVAGGVRMASRPKPDDTKTAKVVRQDIRQAVSATGSVTLQTTAEVKIGAEVSGKVKRLYVDVGDNVHAGQLVAELENAENDAALQQARANVDAAMARVQQAQTQLTQQRPQTAAAIASAAAGVRAAQARYRQARLTSGIQPESTRADIARAQAALDIQRSNLAQVKATANLQVETAQTALDASQAQADQAASNARRARELVAKGYISKSDAETSDTTSRVSAADLAAKKKALELARANAQHDLLAATQSVSQAQASLDSARTGAAQVGVTAAQTEASGQELQTARQSLASARAGAGDVNVRTSQVAEAQASYRQALAEYERQSKNYGKMKIYAPLDGIVTSVDTKEGETVTAGFQTQTLLTVANLNRIQVDVPVDETDIGKLAVGQKAVVNVDAFPNHPLTGRVVKVAAGATVANNVVTYNCTVAIDKASLPLKPKMTATINVETGIVKNALVVPLDAVKTAKDHDVVYSPPGKPVKGKPAPKFTEHDVHTGASDDKVIQVVSGLKEGDTVVVTSSRLDMQRQQEAG
ncbi:MAG TPA: efflux RND transporter periplasmic adaptor subunit [Armatimonadota bacterium]|jgi:RND family efflux transporter MFP subunit